MEEFYYVLFIDNDTNQQKWHKYWDETEMDTDLNKMNITIVQKLNKVLNYCKK